MGQKSSTTFAPVLITASIFIGSTAMASSHREAPFLTENPKVDGTDFYMFRSYEAGRDGNVTFIANYIPLQDGYGGPNFFSMDPDALYEIMVDNNADGTEDLTFQFRFQLNFKDIAVPVGPTGMTKMNSVPLYNVGPIPGMNAPDENMNITESYTVNVVTGPRRTGTSMAAQNTTTPGSSFAKPADLVGQKTSPDYEAYARTFIHGINIPGCATPGKVFVGQRKDPFVVNLGEIFDLINIDVADVTGGSSCDTTQPSRDVLQSKNVTSIALEVPISCLVPGTDPVIGAWTTASLRQARVLNRAATFPTPAKDGGAWTQVSRLGHPLVNEVVIGLRDKNRFNGSHPTEDAALFLDYVTHPTLPKIVGIVFESAVGANIEPQVFPRVDLVNVFLAGVEGLTRPTSPNAMPSEQLRLNTSIAAAPAAMQAPLGVLAGDLAGFPNGRRPGDDVVDISLRAVMGVLLAEGPENPVGRVPFTDCAPTSPGDYDVEFPYVISPVPGSRTPQPE